MPGRYPGVHLLSQTSSCCFCQTLAVWGLVNGGGKSDTPGNGATLGDMKRWEKTQALPWVMNHFIVDCELRRGAGVADGEDVPPKCDRLKPRRPIFLTVRQKRTYLCANFQRQVMLRTLPKGSSPLAPGWRPTLHRA